MIYYYWLVCFSVFSTYSGQEHRTFMTSTVILRSEPAQVQVTSLVLVRLGAPVRLHSIPGLTGGPSRLDESHLFLLLLLLLPLLLLLGSGGEHGSEFPSVISFLWRL